MSGRRYSPADRWAIAAGYALSMVALVLVLALVALVQGSPS